MKLAKMSYISQIVATVGVIPAVWGIFDQTEKARMEEQKTQALLRLTAFPALDGVIQRDRAERENVEKAISELKRVRTNGGVKSAFPTGKTAYHGIPGLADAGRHYEYLGVMVRLGYVEFEPIFEVIAFPDALWNEMEASGLLAMIRTESWSTPEEPLPDFWVNFQHLRSLYESARNPKAPTDQVLDPQSAADRIGHWWREMTSRP
ncbi:MAG: hypothetical protein DVB23_001940 [Verrucomicrobia bacterium]|jgi:hypothetical protein|nr:MAG: hypothetical protein DVB23_001940 [Verrucomicrobiota bacterium]